MPLSANLLERLRNLTDLAEEVPARIGPYRVSGCIGRGGMGVVYDAVDEQLGRRVAVKVMAAFAAPQARERFRREARTAARLRHDHLVPVYAAETPDDGPPYLVMPFIDGPTLLDEITAKRGLDPKTAAVIVRQIADGLVAMHAAGVIHRDVKPGNILLDRADGRAKLTDFGLARADADTLASAGNIAGTPNYLSPEQVHSPDRVDGRSDVYALGATLYECLAAVPPFRGPTLEMLRRIEVEEPLPPRKLQPTTPRELETIALKCLEKDPARRYQTAEALRDDLDRWLADKPIHARPCGAFTTTLKWMRRNRRVAALLALLAVSLVSGLAVSLVLWRRAVEHQHGTELALRQSQANLEAALGVVDRFCTRVSEEELFQKPGLQPVRQKLLTDAVEHYRQFVAARQSDPSSRRDVAKALTRLAHVSLELGQDAEAVAFVQDAIHQHEALRAEQPEAREWRDALGSNYLDLAEAKYRQRDFAGTVAAANEAATLFDDQPRHLAAACVHLASSQGHLGQFPNMRRNFDRAIALQEKTVRDAPQDLEARRQLANTLTLQVAMNMTVKEIPMLERARELKLSLVTARPESDEYRSSLAQTEMNLGVLYKWGGRLDDAVRLYGHAAEILGVLVADNPRVTAWRRNLSRTRFNLGMIHYGREAWSDSRAAFVEARAHLIVLRTTAPNDVSLRLDLASATLRGGETLAHLSRLEEARLELTAASEIIAKLVTDPEDHTFQRSRVNSLVNDYANAARVAERPLMARDLIAQRTANLLTRPNLDREWLTYVIADAIENDPESLEPFLKQWLAQRPQDRPTAEKAIIDAEPEYLLLLP